MPKQLTKTAQKANDVYKRKKKIAQQEKKLEEKLAKRLVSEKKKYDKLIENQKAKIQEQYDKRLANRLKKIKTEYERMRKNKKRKVYGKKAIQNKSNEKIKQKAFSEVQKRAKLSRTDKNWTLIRVDTWKRVHRRKVQWGHIYSKKNFPMLAFEILNIWPIGAMTNKLQWDTTADWIDKTPLTEIEKGYLKQKSENKTLKHKLLDREHYQGMYDKYKKLNDKRLEELVN